MSFQSAAQLTCGRGVLTAGKRRGVRGGTGTGTGTGTDTAGAQGLGGGGGSVRRWLDRGAPHTHVRPGAQTQTHTDTHTRTPRDTPPRYDSPATTHRPPGTASAWLPRSLAPSLPIPK